MFHCFTDNISDTTVTVTGPDVRHIRNVLRMKEGDDFFVSDGNGRNVICCISSLSEEAVIADIISENAGMSELPVDITLYQGLPKADKMELIIQKCVELGVHRIVPVEMSRCIVKLDAKNALKKQERWQKIAESASKQSQRGIIPEVEAVMKYSEALKASERLDMRVVPYELSSDTSALKTLLSGCGGLRSVGIFIGPEGGFEASEIEEAVSCGVIPVTLGRRILRTETAGMALISGIMLGIEAGRT